MTIYENIYFDRKEIDFFRERCVKNSAAPLPLNTTSIPLEGDQIKTLIANVLGNFDQLLEISNLTGASVINQNIQNTRLYYLSQNKFFASKRQNLEEGSYYDCGDLADLPALLMTKLQPLAEQTETLPDTLPFFRKRLDDLLLNQLDASRRATIFQDLNWPETTAASFLRTLLANDTTAILLTKRNLTPYVPFITQIKRKETIQLFIWVAAHQNWFLKFDTEKNNAKGVLKNATPAELTNELQKFCQAVI